MTEEEEKIHDENDMWIARWERLRLNRIEAEKTIKSRLYTERTEACIKEETDLQAEFNQFSPERQELVRNLKDALKERNEDVYFEKGRFERVVQGIVPGLLALGHYADPRECVRVASEIATALIAEVEKEPCMLIRLTPTVRPLRDVRTRWNTARRTSAPRSSPRCRATSGTH